MLFGKYASQKAEARYPHLWDGLVGAWCPTIQSPSGNTLYDLSGRNRHGTLTNMDPAGDWIRNGLDFDGSNDYVDCGTIAGMQFSNTSNFSIACRFLARSTTAERGLITRVNSSDQGWAFTISSGVLRFPAWNAGITASISSNTVYHACVINRAGTREIYLDGRLAVSGTTGTITANTINTVIGRYYGNFAGFCHDGWIDEPAVWSRALSAWEVRLLASRRRVLFAARRPFFGLTATFRFRSNYAQVFTSGVLG